MSLAPATVPVIFTGGLDQKTTDKLVVPGKFLSLENCVRRKTALIEKRSGFAALSTSVFGTTTVISEGLHCDTFEDDLIMFGNQHCYSYSESNNKWSDKGASVSTLVTSTPFVRNIFTQAIPDYAYLNGLSAAIWEDSRGGVRYSIFDDSTGSALVADVELSSGGTRPRVVAFDGVFVFVYYSSSNLKSKVVSLITPTVLGSEATLATSVTSATFDVSTYGNYGVFAYNNTSSLITVGYMTKAGLPGAPGTNALPAPVVTSGTGTASTFLTVIGDAMNSKVWIVYHGSAGIVRCQAWTADLLTSSAVDIATTALARNGTIIVHPTSGVLVGWYERSSATTPTAHYHDISNFFISWTVSSSMSILYNLTALNSDVGLASKAFNVDDDQYVIATHDSTFQPTYFLMRAADGFVAARIASNVGGGHTRDAFGSLKPGLATVLLNGNNEYATVLQIRNKLTVESGGTTLTANKGLNKIALSFNEVAFIGETLGKNYSLAGGSVFSYDGVQIVEHGFHMFPEDTVATTSGSGSLAAGDYSVRFTYEWVDGKGQIHRSAPSITLTTTATLNQKITYAVPTLRVTNKDITSVKVVLYAAAVGLATVYYRVTDIANATSDTVALVLTAPVDTSKEILYTTGGVIENISPPACKVIHAHKSRFFLGGTEDGDIYISKRQVANEGVAFIDAIKVKMESTGGPVTGFETLDDKLVIFKKRRIYILVGDGPTDTGTQNDYLDPQLIASDVGTEEPASIVLTPEGIMFKSEKGIYRLNRSLGLLYIGSGVEDFNSLEVTSAVTIEDQNEVRFTTRTGSCLVYNYYFDQWSTFSNYESVAAVNALGSYMHLKSDGTLQSETLGTFSDNGVRYSMAIETSWMGMAGLQGFQRVYGAVLLGDFVSHHYTRLKIAYDFETAYNETIYYNTITGQQNTDTYGDDATYGDSEVYGGYGSTVFQFEALPTRQKCESIKLRIEDVDTLSATPGGSFKLTAITFKIGRKVGINKFATNKRAGSV